MASILFLNIILQNILLSFSNIACSIFEFCARVKFSQANTTVTPICAIQIINNSKSEIKCNASVKCCKF